MHICVGKLVIIGSDEGLAPGRHQAISNPVLGYCQLDSLEQTSVKFYSKNESCHSQKTSVNIVCEMAAILSMWRWVNSRGMALRVGFALQRTATLLLNL